MFDNEQRLIVCNRRYLELYGFSPDVVKPGIQLADIMRYSVSLGNYTEEEAARALAERPDPNRAQEAHDDQAAPERWPHHRRHERADGRRRLDRDLPRHHRDRERHAQTLQAIPQQLERSNSELQEFAYVASHDLQEPLRKIEAFGDRLHAQVRQAAARGRPHVHRPHAERRRPHAPADQRSAVLLARDDHETTSSP